MFGNPMHILKKRARVIVVVGLLTALASLIVSLLFPLEYRADAQVLIISQSRYGVDPYTVVRSAERVGENIAQVMETNDFFSKVMSQDNYNLDKSRFENVTERTKRKRWQRAIEGSVIFGTGVLNVSAYHKDPDQAERFAGAAVDTLVEKGWEYVGGDVTIKIVNNPVVSKWPVRPNVAMNALLGFVVGVVIMSLAALQKGGKMHI